MALMYLSYIGKVFQLNRPPKQYLSDGHLCMGSFRLQSDLHWTDSCNMCMIMSTGEYREGLDPTSRALSISEHIGKGCLDSMHMDLCKPYLLYLGERVSNF
ncbi:hypothetical protein GDO81_000286 [Engystomops pustulosus]|uniref:Uncharacterized protein n=1 Tax=Engystomops pustulosus TaxID=76066 RepID=A0AAV7D4V4_ENGPU|nr:hypothetical protein GDO81_000286 [Engystomops pustulosus]